MLPWKCNKSMVTHTNIWDSSTITVWFNFKFLTTLFLIVSFTNFLLKYRGCLTVVSSNLLYCIVWWIWCLWATSSLFLRKLTCSLVLVNIYSKLSKFLSNFNFSIDIHISVDHSSDIGIFELAVIVGLTFTSKKSSLSLF